MKENTYMSRRLDMKRLFLVLGRKIWLLVIGILAGAVIGGLCYKIVTSITNGETEYQASADYYITFNVQEYEDGPDYYNAFTWDSVLRDDPIVDYALSVLPAEFTKDGVKASVRGEMLGDYRILTVHTTADTKEEADTLALAFQKSLEHFGDSLELFDKIELWSLEKAAVMEKNTRTINASFLGGILGGILITFLLLFYYLLEDGTYAEKDAADRFGLKVYGVQTKGNSEAYRQMMKDNLDTAFGIEEIETWNAEFIPSAGDYERLRKAKHLLLNIPWGRNNGRQADRVLQLLELQNCRVEGCIITEADDKFLKAYYMVGKK